jgi:manganese-dependent ADP-ribose/CDP-alcohol diphosphatase
VADFNTMDLDFVTHLGDFIDRDFKNFDVLNPIFDKLTVPKYHVLGNHDFSVADHLKKDVPAKLGMPAKYYDYEVKGWRYVVLDGNDVSFHAYPEGSEEAQAAADYYESKQIKSPKWNGAIGAQQLTWLKTVLEKAQANKEAVILFCHFPVYPQNGHNLWNADEVMALLESYPCVKAYINGHNHHGNYCKKGGVHYVTLKGMVETETNSSAVIKVSDDTIDIVGYGRENIRSLQIDADQ